MNQNPPFFSIIIPTYNRPEQLRSCLDAISHLDYSRDRFEVIVVDDGSEIPPETVIALYHDRLDLTLQKKTHTGAASTRNAGVSRARGEFLAFIDDDCIPAPDWLNTLAVCFRRENNCAIGGRIVNAFPENIYSATSQLLVDYLYTCYNTDPSRACFFSTSNLAIPSKDFRALDGFNTHFSRAGEDREFCDHLVCNGYKMIYTPEVLVHHSRELTFRSFCLQHFNYGRSAFDFRHRYSRHGCKPVMKEPLSFYLNLLLFPFSQSFNIRNTLHVALLLVSQIVHTVGYLSEYAHRKSPTST